MQGDCPWGSKSPWTGHFLGEPVLCWERVGFSKQNLAAREAPVGSVAESTGLSKGELPHPTLGAFVL